MRTVLHTIIILSALAFAIPEAHARGYVSCRGDSCIAGFFNLVLIVGFFVLLFKAADVRVKRLGKIYKLSLGLGLAALLLSIAVCIAVLTLLYSITKDFSILSMWVRGPLAIGISALSMWYFVTRYR